MENIIHLFVYLCVSDINLQTSGLFLNDSVEYALNVQVIIGA